MVFPRFLRQIYKASLLPPKHIKGIAPPPVFVLKESTGTTIALKLAGVVPDSTPAQENLTELSEVIL